jgi:uncharacterized protein YjbI with pentapeptide repeats
MKLYKTALFISFMLFGAGALGATKCPEIVYTKGGVPAADINIIQTVTSCYDAIAMSCETAKRDFIRAVGQFKGKGDLIIKHIQQNSTGMDLSSMMTDYTMKGAEVTAKAGECNVQTDFSNQDLSGQYLGDKNLSGVNFSGANLSGTMFNYANLSGANFSGAIISETTVFYNANLSGANFTGTKFGSMSHLQSVNLSGVDLKNIILTDVLKISWSDLTNFDFTGLVMDKIILERNKLVGVDFSGVSPATTYFQIYACDASGANFNGLANIRMFTFQDTVFFGAKFTNMSNLQGGFPWDMRSVDFTGTTFGPWATFINSQLQGATLPVTGYTGMMLSYNTFGVDGSYGLVPPTAFQSKCLNADCSSSTPW